MFASPLVNTPSARDYSDIMCEIKKLPIHHEFDNEIPTIVVFGDMSCGKSSVLSRLTGGLPLPRGSNKCTATPFEIRLLQTERRLRTISLRVVEDKYHRRISPKEVDFADITYSNEKEIEQKLFEAQRFAQNPTTIINQDSQLPEDDELEFTRNAVCVTISGPDQMYSLSMVDLPGIIRNNADYEDFILKLVKEYIEKESAIIVPIFQATSDIFTQCAWLRAREVDPQGLRTVGVLTKMDRIDLNDDETHLELATLVKGNEGEFQIENGTYVIRNPPTSQHSRQDDLDELERATIRTLRQHRIWKDVPPNRYGLDNLAMKLSELQGKAHEKSWPKIRLLLEESRTDFEEKLKKLPLSHTGNPIKRFMELIGKFDKEFTSHAQAENVDHRLYRGQQWNFGQFDQALLNTRPRYKLGFEDSNSINDTFDPIKPGALQYRIWTNLSLNELHDCWGENIDKNYISQYMWKLDRLCETVQSSQGGQMVGYFPYKAVVSIVAQHQKEWFMISAKLLDKNHDWVAQFMTELADETFKEFPNAVDEIKKVLRELLKECKTETGEHLRDLEEMEHMSASRALYVTDEASVLKKQSKYFAKFRILSAAKQGSQELRVILSLGSRLSDMMQEPNADEYEFNDIKNDLIQILQETKVNQSPQLLEEVRNATLGVVPSTATKSIVASIKNAYLDKLIGVTPKSEDLNRTNRTVLSNTIREHAFLAATGALAYWKMAHTKFREIVPRIVEFYLVHKFAMRLGMYLRSHFKITGQDDKPVDSSLKDLLSEDPEIAKNSKEWRETVDALSAIIDRVRKAGRRSGGGGGGGGGSGGSSNKHRYNREKQL